MNMRLQAEQNQVYTTGKLLTGSAGNPLNEEILPVAEKVAPGAGVSEPRPALKETAAELDFRDPGCGVA
jgi:hypothetical protein